MSWPITSFSHSENLRQYEKKTLYVCMTIVSFNNYNGYSFFIPSEIFAQIFFENKKEYYATARLSFSRDSYCIVNSHRLK